MAYTRYTGGPYWKRAKAQGTSADGTPFRKGERAFFYPRTDSHDQQIAVCKRANGQAHAIRRMLTTEKVATSSGAFVFVGRDAYVEHSGNITPDLFSQGDAGYADQPDLVQELAEEKLDAIAQKYRAMGWHEAKAALAQPYDLYMKGSMYPATREATEAEAERLAGLDTEMEAIAETEGEDSPALVSLSEERDAITAAFRAFNAEQVAIGGVALWVSHDGSLGKSFYRAKAEPKPKKEAGEPQPSTATACARTCRGSRRGSCRKPSRPTRRWRST